jgi:hypothetical protein
MIDPTQTPNGPDDPGLDFDPEDSPWPTAPTRLPDPPAPALPPVVAEIETEPEPEPAPEPERQVEAEPEPEPELELESEATVEVQPEPVPEPVVEPVPQPVAEFVPELEQEVTTELEPIVPPEPRVVPTRRLLRPGRKPLIILGATAAAIVAFVVPVTLAATAGGVGHPGDTSGSERAAAQAGPQSVTPLQPSSTAASPQTSAAPGRSSKPAASTPAGGTTSNGSGVIPTPGNTYQNSGGGGSVTTTAPVRTTSAPKQTTPVYYSGASCGRSWYMYGTWYELSGSSIDGCGDGYTREQTGNHGNVDWYFNPGTGVSCTFRLYIPDSSKITTISAHYMLYGASDHSNWIKDHYMQQAGHGGSWLTFNDTPISSSTGSFDLFLSDDRDIGQVEVAAAATATCS